MKSFLTIILICLSLTGAWSQTNFEKGYFIDNNGTKTECLIQNKDWKNNPSEFSYKLNETDNIKPANISEIKLFEIYGKSKYVRYTVMIDRSLSIPRTNVFQNDEPTSKEPSFNEETLFLEILIEGEVSLYSYEEKNILKFFIKTEDSEVAELIHKGYVEGGTYEEKKSYYRENNSYKEQLRTALSCSNINYNTLKKTQYLENELIRLFTKYYECKKSEYNNYANLKNKSNFKLFVKPGVHLSTLSLDYISSTTLDPNFETELGYKLGLEIEYKLPFQNNKWAIFTGTNFVSYKFEDDRYNFKYNALEIPLGIRYRSFINNNSCIFINGSMVFSNCLKLDFSNYSNIILRGSPVIGLGYEFKNKIAIEAQYSFSRNVIMNLSPFEGKLSGFSVVLGYAIF